MFDRIWDLLTGGRQKKEIGSDSRKATTEQKSKPAPVSRAPGATARQWSEPAQQQRQYKAPVGGGQAVQPGPRYTNPVGGAQGQLRSTPYRAPVAGYTLNEAPRLEREEAKRTQNNKAATSLYNQRLIGDAGDETKVVEMDWDSYAALNPRQRAAVDANTEMVKAIDADKNQMHGVADQSYTETVNKLFGPDRGSDTVAPRTVALLDKMFAGQSLDGPVDLDQYLSKHALVDEKDLTLLTPESVQNISRIKSGLGKTGNTEDGRYYSADRYEKLDPRAENALAFSTAAQARLGQTLAGGQSLISSLQAEDIGAKLFGEPSESIGFGMNDRDQGLQAMFNALARADAPEPDEELGQQIGMFLENTGLSDAQLSQFFETKLRAAEYGGTKPLAEDPSDPEATYMAPAEFRARYLGGK